jgi:hypothetical protein
MCGGGWEAQAFVYVCYLCLSCLVNMFDLTTSLSCTRTRTLTPPVSSVRSAHSHAIMSCTPGVCLRDCSGCYTLCYV